MIAAYVSALNACRFCVGVHRAVAERFGVNPELFEELADDLERAPIGEELRPVLRYVRKLNAAPSTITAADAGSICALFNLFNRLADGLGIVGKSEFFSAAAMILTTAGGHGAVVRTESGPRPSSATGSDRDSHTPRSLQRPHEPPPTTD